ncbi:hypothetical protein JM946_00270 [Steroidobacter sp. S1-65]|uniref:DUF4129 domain-containing protein n=1 Tax=Steroidobacter gossypii TaxID=2805490 RepID=A0ABS1WQB1_9GAMM|nr:hypothetical protein [Steroidobacter gossypii]MBM0103153.1 hypothetical protein [Steroidobacter gossypii]
MRLSVAVLIFLCVPAAFAQSEAPARQVLQECADSIPPDVVGIEQIEAACPGVEQALDELGLTELMFQSQFELLKRDGLDALLALANRYEHPPERAAANVARLGPVLDSMRRPPTPEASKSWWERLKERLRQLFNQSEAPPDSWLIRWLDEHRMPELVRSILLYGAMAIVVALAVLIVVNEIRAARSGRRRKRAATTVAMQAHPVLTDNSEPIAPGEGPSALLKMLVATLIKTGRVHGGHALTHRELTRRARFDDSSQRESFQKLAQVAEREVFGGMAVANEELTEAIRAGRSLEEQLNGAAT